MTQSTLRAPRPIRWAVVLAALAFIGATNGMAGAAARASFRLTARPTVVTVGRDGAATMTLTAARRAGFATPIGLNSSVLPAGVQVSVRQNPLIGSSTVVTFTATSAAKLGRTPITISGVAGKASASVRFTVNIVATAPANAVPLPVDAGSSISVPIVGGPAGPVPIVNPATLLLASGQSASVIFSPTGARAGVTTSYGVSGLPPGLTAEIVIIAASVQVRFTAAASLPSGPIVTVLRASQDGIPFATASVTLNPGPSTPTTTGTPAASTTTPVAVTVTSSTITTTTNTGAVPSSTTTTVAAPVAYGA